MALWRFTGRGLVARVGLCFVLAALMVPGACAAQPAATAEERLKQAQTALRTGKYDEAIERYAELAGAADASVPARRGHVRSLMEVGRYEDAEAAARNYAAAPNGAQLSVTLADALAARGKIDEARQALERALAGGASDSLTARLRLALMAKDRGETMNARRQLETFIEVYNERRRSLSSDELTAVGVAVRELGATDPQLFKDAVRAFDAAIAADSTNLEPRVLLGELFLEKYNAPDAREMLDRVLRQNPRHPRALLAMARLSRFEGAPGSEALVRRSLETNPNFVEGRAQLATLELESESYDRAAEEARKALAIDPTSIEALSALAATHYLRGEREQFERVRRQVEAQSPRSAELYTTMAELSARHRLYSAALEFAQRAVVVDSSSWRAFALLGTNQMRLGRVDEARRNLERAFAGDPYDVWVKNTLDLLDTFGEYRDVRTPRFQLVLDSAEAELLGPYLGELMEAAYDSLAARYDYRPATPVRLEVYRRHADFSVRTVGLAGLGALGVSFGNVLAMDSPAAREVGAFNWGSTAWHELAHAFTLGMTDHRVPRWLSEGISVYEERRARAGWGWGADVGLDFLAAYKTGRLNPVSRLNDGFMRPAYPEQVMHSYYQASLVAELIERDWGQRALVDMLHAYRDGASTDQVFRRALKTDPATFDKRFDAYMRERFAGPLAAIEVTLGDSGAVVQPSPEELARRARDEKDFLGQLAAGRRLFEEGRREEAVPYLERAKALFPGYAGPGNAYWLLAQIHRERGNARAAADELGRLTALSETEYEANVALAELLVGLGDTRGAAAALERALYISPFDPAVHERLATLASTLGDHRVAIRERRALVALRPVDRAEALYQLAVAYRDGGDAAAARRTVLSALEEAPNFAKAQDLLLALPRDGAGARSGRP